MFYELIFLCTALVSLVVPIAIHGKNGELKAYLKITHCSRRCLYGFQTDLEGGTICKCYDPCANIMCPPGLQCVVEEQTWCNPENVKCRYAAMCIELLMKTDDVLSPNEVTYTQSDGPIVSHAISGMSQSVCDQEPTRDIHKCERKIKRWFYDSKFNKCTKFLGCETEGNNFGTKKACKMECKQQSNRRPNKAFDVTAGLVSFDGNVCSLSHDIDTMACEQTLRRWYFDATSGRCVKFHGCAEPGNNFKTKQLCKRKCKGDSKQGHKQTSRQDDTENAISASLSGEASLCLTQPSSALASCDHRIVKRWFFDAKHGKCRRFKTCDVDGESFTNRRACKQQCMKKKSRRNKTRRRKERQRQARVKLQKIEQQMGFIGPETYYTAACRAGVRMVMCEKDPCLGCHRDGYVLCEVNLCGECSANYYDRRTLKPLDGCIIT